MKNMNGIRAVFKLKGNKAEKPDMYIGESGTIPYVPGEVTGQYHL